MRVAILSDIHANAEALEAVLADARACNAEHYLCLGDTIGFNGDPAACVSRAMQLFSSCVRGNHEMRPEDVEGMISVYDEKVCNNVYVEEQFPHIKYLKDDIQTIITTTDIDMIDKQIVSKAKIITIDNGKVIKQEGMVNNE